MRQRDYFLFLDKEGIYTTDLSDYHEVTDGKLQLKEEFEDTEFINDEYYHRLSNHIQELAKERKLDQGFEFDFNDVKVQAIFFKERGGINNQIVLYSPERKI